MGLGTVSFLSRAPIACAFACVCMFCFVFERSIAVRRAIKSRISQSPISTMRGIATHHSRDLRAIMVASDSTRCFF